jgi:rare lipoprotein A
LRTAQQRFFIRSALAVVALTAGLGGCGSEPSRGGYYKDDGPGGRVPSNLDKVPDAKPRVEPLHPAANNAYTALGKRYVPYKTLKPYRERGIASWYGRRFHGQPTSSGERYDMYAMSAAHTILPIPSYARVTNLANGRSVIVRVNDRGPFHSGRIIDLSYAAAHRLGYVGSGSARVEVEAILPGKTARRTGSAPATPAPATAATPIEAGVAPALAAPQAQHLDADIPLAIDPRGVFLQLGAFSSRENAEDMRAKIYRRLDWLNDPVEIRPRGGLYRLYAGPYRDRAAALEVAARIDASMQLTPVVVVR